MRDTNPWMVVLSQVLATESFIIAGTRLDEPDLEFYLSTRNTLTQRSARGPSLLIEPYPDAVTQKACEVHGLTLVKATLSEFLQWVLLTLGAPPRYTERLPKNKSLLGGAADQRKLASFFADFSFVEPQDLQTSQTDLSFFYGRTPTWADIASNTDIVRLDTFDLVEYCRNLLKDSFSKERLVLITGHAGSGKSALAKRVAFDLMGDGYLLFDCRSSARIDSTLAIECLSGLKIPFVILVDDFADHVQQIRPLLETTKITTNFVVLACERDYRIPFVDLRLEDTPRKIKKVKKLSTKERIQLVHLFKDKGLLGNEYAAKKPEEFAKYADDEDIAFFVCRLLNDFRPLDKIANSLFIVATPEEQIFYAACSLAQFCYRVGVNFNILQSLDRQLSLEQQIAGKSSLPLAYNIDDDNYVVPLNPILADRVVQLMSREHPDTLFRVFVQLAQAVAPQVTRTTIMDKTPEAKLAQRLFDADGVIRPLLGNNGARFYDELRNICAWNSRYWEQRALFTADDDLQTAIQYARHAVAIEQHPYTYTTLAKLLLRAMRLPGSNREYLFEEAYSKLCSAIDHEQQYSRVSIHPFVTLFTGTGAFLEFGGVLGAKKLQQLRTHLNFATFRYRRDNDLQNAAARVERLLSP